MRVKKATIIRTAILILSIINEILVIMGKEILPISDEQLNLYISTAFMSISSLISWWKNNSFTKEAIEADNMMKSLRKK